MNINDTLLRWHTKQDEIRRLQRESDELMQDYARENCILNVGDVILYRGKDRAKIDSVSLNPWDSDTNRVYYTLQVIWISKKGLPKSRGGRSRTIYRYPLRYYPGARSDRQDIIKAPDNE